MLTPSLHPYTLQLLLWSSLGMQPFTTTLTNYLFIHPPSETERHNARPRITYHSNVLLSEALFAHSVETNDLSRSPKHRHLPTASQSSLRQSLLIIYKCCEPPPHIATPNQLTIARDTEPLICTLPASGSREAAIASQVFEVPGSLTILPDY